MKLKNKIALEGLFHSLLQLICIFTFAWFHDCIFEMCIVYVCFFYFRTKFTKQYHALTSWGCTFITIIVYYLISLWIPNKSTTLLLIIIFTYFINYISYCYKDYLDFLKVKKHKIYKGMNKKVLLNKCKMYNLTEIETKIMVMYYCDKLKRWQIGNVVGYSEDNISKIKEKILKRFQEEPK